MARGRGRRCTPRGASWGRRRTRAASRAGTRPNRGMRRPSPERPGRTRRRRSGADAGPRCRGVTSRPAPVRGGSRTTRSAWICCRTSGRTTRSTRPWRHSTCRRDAVLRIPSTTAGRCPSTASTEPDGPTASARAAAKRPAPAYRSRTFSPASGRSVSRTWATKVGAAPGWTCQNPRAPMRNSPDHSGGLDALDDGGRASVAEGRRGQRRPAGRRRPHRPRCSRSRRCRGRRCR